jgi:MarR family transcriptional regulator, organic hydroperoxide resistance regulator
MEPALDDLLCFAMHSAAHAMARAYQPLLEPLGLTYAQYLVLVVLWGGDGLTVSALGERLFLGSSTLTPLLKRLEDQGRVRRERDRADQRLVRVFLTPAGAALRTEYARISACVFEASGLDGPRLVALRDALAGLRDRLDAGT